MTFDGARQKAQDGVQPQSDVKDGNPVTDAQQVTAAQQQSEKTGGPDNAQQIELLTRTVLSYVQQDANKVCLDVYRITTTELRQISKFVNGLLQDEVEMSRIGY